MTEEQETPATKPRKIRNWVRKTLTRSDQPVWVTLCLMIITAVLTYAIAPKINSNFEKERRRSELILAQTKQINTSTREVLSIATTLIRIEDTARKSSSTEVLLNKLTGLQWQVLEVRSMPRSEKIKTELETFSTSIIELGIAARQFEKSDNDTEFEKAVGSFAAKTASLNSAIYEISTK